MAYLDNFSDEEKSLLIALPYRAGLWVGRADKTGGLQSHAEEEAALEHIIERKSKGMFQSALVHEIMAEAYLNKIEWKNWHRDLDQTPNECEKAAALIAEKLGKHELDAYRQNILDISILIAKAFREFDKKTSFLNRTFRYLKIRIDSLFGALTGQTYDSKALLSISEEEDLAIAALSKALCGDSDVRSEEPE